MFNKIVMIGNLTRDVELRYLPSGSALATIGLASNRRYKKQDGSVAEEPCFIDVKLFGRTAEIANQYLRRGSRILVEGRLTYETWTDQSGVKKSRHVITAENMNMLDARSGNSGEHVNQDPQGNQAPRESAYAAAPSQDMNHSAKENYTSNLPEIDIDNDDEVPF